MSAHTAASSLATDIRRTDSRHPAVKLTAMPGTYDAHARERLEPEPGKRPGRSTFERDRARIVHSAALRRLSAKTQVLGAGSDDFVRNRLTHSMEVAQVARELGKSLGCDPDIVDSGALAHDLGHPPFGHNGETILNQLAEAAGGFEGNAQTLRILTRLEAKTADGSGRSVGLNLSRATLAACIKYPWQRSETTDGKFGVYDDDVPVFAWLRKGVPAHQRSIEAQVMDLSDDIAYSVHDVEDAVVGGWFGLDDEHISASAIVQVARDWFDPAVTSERLDQALSRLRNIHEWPETAFDGSRVARAQLKRLTSALIGRFVTDARTATVDAAGPGPLVLYDAHLHVPDQTRDEIMALKSLAAHYVMRSDDRAEPQRKQRELLAGLVQRLAATEDRFLEPEFADDLRMAVDDARRMRAVIDQVASLTDVSARQWGYSLLS